MNHYKLSSTLHVMTIDDGAAEVNFAHRKPNNIFQDTEGVKRLNYPVKFPRGVGYGVGLFSDEKLGRIGTKRWRFFIFRPKN